VQEPIDPAMLSTSEWPAVLSLAERILDHIAVAVITTDLEGRITYVNRFAAELYLRNVDELMGSFSGDFVEGWVDQQVVAEISAALSSGATWSGDFRVRRGDGTTIMVRATDSPIYDHAGALAGVVSVAVDVTERRRAEQALLESWSRFADVAQTLQQSLLPPELPHVPGLEVAAHYRAAGDGTEVGGDFYDLFETAKDDWSLVIGDVQGKGARAAAITALARYTIRAAAMKNRKPSVILSVLNQAVLEQHPERHCTVAFARLRRTGGRLRLTVASGGHPLPLLVRGDQISSIGRTGLLVGAFEEFHVPDSTIDLAAGDTIVVYTDGVTEGRSGTELWGDRRLHDVLRSDADATARAVADRVAEAVVAFQGGMPADDLAIIVAKVLR